MALILGSSFTKQLKRLPLKEQGVVSRTVLDMQIDATARTLSIHKVDGGEGWWSAYANGDLRIIFSRMGDGDLVLCWTDHHDAAYIWARRHKIEKHPVTKSMQLVEIPEVAELGELPSGGRGTARPAVATRPICARLGVTKDELLGWGVPELWIDRVLAATSEDELLDIGERHLPPEAAEAVLCLAVGERPDAGKVDAADGHAGRVTLSDEESQSAVGNDAWNRQSWWVVSEDDDLKTALEDLDWDAWCTYLHPVQRKIAYRLYDGPRRVCGSAGTGKTVVALHHAKHVLSEVPEARVLITTFSQSLVKDLRRRCVPLMGAKLLERCRVDTLAGVARELFDRLEPGHPRVLDRQDLDTFAYQTFNTVAEELPDMRDSARFVLSEFERVVEPRQIRSEEEYLKAKRRGVHTRLSATRRKAIWAAIERVYDGLKCQSLMTTDQMIGWLAEYYKANPGAPRYYSHIVVDECQDLCEVELDFLMAYLGGMGRIFFAGDIGQRIIRYSFPWKPYGVDLRGRSRVLKVNYRTTHEIRSMADRLMTADVADADDVPQDRRGTVSLLTGPKPDIRKYATPEEEAAGVAEWLTHLERDLGVKSDEVALFCRSDAQRDRVWKAVKASSYKDAFTPPLVETMFKAKGLEYRAAVVMACDNGVIPSPERLAEADLVAGMEEIYDTERNLLYVACTRARDYLLITCGGVPSEFLLDMGI